MRLIVTRPEPDATRTARALIRLGHEAILSPSLAIVPDRSVPIAPRDYQAVVATSSNAVRALAEHAERPVPLHTPLLAVGDQTALEAKRAGFVAARSAGGGVDALLALVRRTLSPAAGPLLYVAGKERTGDVAEWLAAEGFDVETAIVYRAEPVKALADVAIAALREGTVDGILFYSSRSAAAFALALRAAGLAPLEAKVTCYCLSESIAERLASVTTGQVAAAARPEQIALFALIEERSAESPAGGAA